jgi:hypothetical protein
VKGKLFGIEFTCFENGHGQKIFEAGKNQFKAG